MMPICMVLAVMCGRTARIERSEIRASADDTISPPV
jgi:hypothetical protein